MPRTGFFKIDKQSLSTAGVQLTFKMIAAVVLLVTAGIVTGWLFDLRALKTLFVYNKVVPGNLALLWLLTTISFFSIAINLKIFWLRTAGAILAGILVVITLYATLAGYFFHNLPYTSFAIQLMEDVTAIEIPGNMVWVEALPIFTTNLFLLLIYFQQVSRISFLLIVIALWPICQALVGYMFDLPDLYTFCTNEECARLHPVLALMALAMCGCSAVITFARRPGATETPV